MVSYRFLHVSSNEERNALILQRLKSNVYPRIIIMSCRRTRCFKKIDREFSAARPFRIIPYSYIHFKTVKSVDFDKKKRKQNVMMICNDCFQIKNLTLNRVRCTFRGVCDIRAAGSSYISERNIGLTSTCFCISNLISSVLNRFSNTMITTVVGGFENKTSSK